MSQRGSIGTSSGGRARGRRGNRGKEIAGSSSRNTHIDDSQYYHDVTADTILDHEMLETRYGNQSGGVNLEETPEFQASPPEVQSDLPAEPLTRIPAKRKERSDVWDFASKNIPEQTASCGLCDKVWIFRTGGNEGGTGKLRAHLAKKHPKEWATRAGGIYLGTEHGGVAHDQSSGTQARINQTTGGILTYDKQKDREAIAKLVALEGLPYSFPSSTGFVRYVQAVYNPSFRGFPRTTVKNDIIRFKNEYQDYLRYMFDNFDTRVCLTTDLGRSTNGCDYITVTCHWIDPDWVFQKRIIAYKIVDEPHTGNYICNKVSSICRTYFLSNKVFSITVDNATNNTDALRNLIPILNPPFPEFFHVRCACHIYNLVVRDGLNLFNDIIKKVQIAITYIFRNKNQDRRREWERKCVELGMPVRRVPKEVCTRWNTLYEALKVAYEYRLPISQMYNKHFMEIYHLKDEDWQVVQHLLQFLHKFYQATLEFSGQYYPTTPTMLYYIAGIAELLKMYKQYAVYLPAVELMIEKFRKYFFPIPPLFYIASVLHPAFKIKLTERLVREVYANLEITPEEIATNKFPSVDEAVAKVYADTVAVFAKYRAWADTAEPTEPILSTGQSSSQAGAGMRTFGGLDEKLLSEQDEYGEEYSEFQVYLIQYPKKLNNFGTANLLDYWKNQESQFPILAKMARDILTIQASSVASESAFSQGRFQIGDHRYSLRQEAMETGVLFRDWIRAERRNFGLPELTKERGRAYIDQILSDGTSEGSQTGNEEEEEDEEPEGDDEQDQQQPVPKEKPTSVLKKLANMFKRM